MHSQRAAAVGEQQLHQDSLKKARLLQQSTAPIAGAPWQACSMTLAPSLPVRLPLALSCNCDTH